jgi:uncharacterized protein (DUF849 family)
MTSDAVILEVAVNGGTPRAANPLVPVTPDEIAVDALHCLDGGAAIVHQHDEFAAFTSPGPEGMAEAALAAYREVLRYRPDAVLYPTANFRGATIADRWGHHEVIARTLAAEGLPPLRMGLLDPGSLAFGPTGPDGVPSGGYVYAHSFDDIRWKADACTRLGLAPSIAVFEPGFLRVVLAYRDAGLLPAGAFVKLYFSAGRPLFGLPPESWALDTYLHMLRGTDLTWAVAVFGADVIETGIARQALENGGHLRVGLEDVGTTRQVGNRQLVDEAAALCAELGRPLATPTQALEILDAPTR